MSVTGYWLLGIIIGAILQYFASYFLYKQQTKTQRELDKKRKDYLLIMLKNPGPKGWRKMETLSSVIGASRDDTARLLIELGARASETGNDTWALIKDMPLPTGED